MPVRILQLRFSATGPTGLAPVTKWSDELRSPSRQSAQFPDGTHRLWVWVRVCSEAILDLVELRGPIFCQPHSTIRTDLDGTWRLI